MQTFLMLTLKHGLQPLGSYFYHLDTEQNHSNSLSTLIIRRESLGKQTTLCQVNNFVTNKRQHPNSKPLLQTILCSD